MKNLIYLLLVACTGTVCGQVTFNKRYHFDYLAAVGTSVVPFDSGYYYSGVLVDTLPPYNDGGFFAVIGLDGTVASFRPWTSSDFGIGPWFNTLTQLQDSSFVLSSVYIDTLETTMFIGVGKTGDTVFTKTYINPGFPEFTFMQPRGGLERLPGGGYIVGNWMDNDSGGILNMDVNILKIDGMGALEWQRSFVHKNLDLPASIVVDNLGNAIIGWWTTDLNHIFEGFTSQIKLVKLDGGGETLWEYTTPESIGLRDAPNDMVLLGDGSLVIASGVGTEIERPTGNTIWFEKLLFKLSPDGDIVWENVYENPGPKNSSAKLTNVIEISDGSGFVTAGMESVLGLSNFTIKGWLAKVAHDGQTIWTRRYLGVDSNEPIHEIFDLRECPDGGFILAGESQDGTWQTIPPQQAWLLKLDQHGCLVPGCHLLDDAEEEIERPLQLSIYPNPATDYLNFQLRSNSIIKDGIFRIASSDGKLILEFEMDVRIEDTYSIPVWEWPSGIYFLQYLDLEGQVIMSEKFIVSP